MSFDGIFISKMCNELQIINGGKITKIYQVSIYETLLVVRNHGVNHKLLISTHPENSRIQLTYLDMDKPKTPPSFVMFLRKHLEGGIIKNIKQIKSDRIIEIDVLKTNELGDKHIKHIICEMMGRYSNLIITSEDYKILDATKHIHPFDGFVNISKNSNSNKEARTIAPHATYTYPIQDSIQIDTINIKDSTIFNDMTEILGKYQGVSKLLAKELVYRKSSFESLLSDDIKPCLTSVQNKDYFYFTELYHISGEFTYFDNLSTLLDYYFKNKDQKTRVKQRASDLEKFLKSKIERNKKKIKNFNKDLETALNADKYKILGELIYSNLHIIEPNVSSAEVMNYYENKTVKIPLDKKLSAKKNAEKFFKKYNKLKNSIEHINKQISIAIEENKYLEIVYSQLMIADIYDIEEIRLELETNKYIRRKVIRKNKKRKPNYTAYVTSEATIIYVGKNNIQNEFLTHKHARANDLWFHVKDSPGSHVLVKKQDDILEYSEQDIRTAACIAAYFSKYKDSTSVPVDYTKARYVKKIPGKQSCFVRYTEQKTIYIDPTEEIFKELKVLK